MNSANFLLWAPISCRVLPLLRNSFKAHQLFRSALKFMVRLFAYVYYPISCRIHWAQGQLLKKDKGRRDLGMNSSQHSMSNMSSRRVGEESSKLMNELCHHRLPTAISSNSSSALGLGYQFGVCAFSGQAAPGHVILFICRLFLVIICCWFWVAGFNVRTGLEEVTCTTAASVTNVTPSMSAHPFIHRHGFGSVTTSAVGFKAEQQCPGSVLEPWGRITAITFLPWTGCAKGALACSELSPAFTLN